MITEIVATFATGVFAGAALYINIVEQPARLQCGIEAAVTQWRPSYKRATLMQAPLAVIGFLGALGSWWAGGGWAWLAGGILIFAVVPFTLLVILPTNQRLQSEHLDISSAEAVRLLRWWGRLHAFRTVLSFAAFVVLLFALSRATLAER
jgi:hypothetical protein